MLKAVLDTTVLVASLLTPKGLSRSLIERARSKEFELCLSPEIIVDTQTRLIKHPHLRQRYNYSDEEVAYFISGLRLISTPVLGLPNVQVVRDPNDDFIIATAIKAEADYLVARDNDLLILGSYDKIQIVSPETFAQVLTDASNT